MEATFKDYYIVGAGAVGLALYARLTRALNMDCSLIGSPSRSTERTLNLEIESCGQNWMIQNCRIFPRLPRDLRGAWVIVTTKAYDLYSVISTVVECQNVGGIAVCCNGIGILDSLPVFQKSVPHIRGLMNFGVTREERGTTCIRVTTHGPLKIVLTYNSSSINSVQRIEEAFRISGFHVEVSTDQLTHEWRKGIVNTVVNSIATLYEEKNKVVLSRDVADKYTCAAFNEAVRIAQARGADVADLNWESFKKMVSAYGENVNSTLIDFRSNRKTEIDYFLGEIIRAGRQLAVPCPVLEAIQVKLLEKLHYR